MKEFAPSPKLVALILIAGTIVMVALLFFTSPSPQSSLPIQTCSTMTPQPSSHPNIPINTTITITRTVTASSDTTTLGSGLVFIGLGIAGAGMFGAFRVTIYKNYYSSKDDDSENSTVKLTK